MKFLADENVDAPIVHLLRQNGYEISYILEDNPSISDDAVLLIAVENDSILITQDKDFGELVYLQKKVHAGILLLRLTGLKPARKAEIVLSVIQEHEQELYKSFTIIQQGMVKIRKWEEG